MRTFRSTRRTVIPFLVALALATGSILAFCGADVVQPRFPLTFEGMLDTDDMCIWIHPTDPSLSTIIAADKSARIIVVYDLSGDVLQTFSVLRTETALEQPGNIDLRYGFPLGDELIDIVAFNQRSGSTLRSIHVYMVDPETRLLSRIDDGNIATHRNYGMCLYKSPSTGKFYAFATSEKREGVEQYELFDNGDGQIMGTEYGAGTRRSAKVRSPMTNSGTSISAKRVPAPGATMPNPMHRPRGRTSPLSERTASNRMPKV